MGTNRYNSYPDGEIVTYKYNKGGQLYSMQGEKARQSYKYIDYVYYDKFGAKLYEQFGNGLKSSFSYNPNNQRLTIRL